jgi:hypothetical protein
MARHPSHQVQFPETGEGDENLFESAHSIIELLGHLAGYASACWGNLEGAGVFLSDDAKKGVEHAYSRLQQLLPREAQVSLLSAVASSGVGHAIYLDNEKARFPDRGGH